MANGRFDVDEYIFSENEFCSTVDWNSVNKSAFDTKIENSWLSKENYFRYKLNIDDSKILGEEFGFIAQLNIDRAVKRRTPEDIRDVKQPFSPEKFNFTKVNLDEVMFFLSKEGTSPESDMEKNYYLINVSPLEFCHTLLLPSLFKCLPQIASEESLYFALHTMLLSSSPEFRVGFNSLCGFATVNHLHFHAYYLSRKMKLETIMVEPLAGGCHILEQFPSKGFVFELKSPTEITSIVKKIYKLTSYFIDENIAHNLYMTRGLRFERSAQGEESSERDCIRIYVWARSPSCGAKELDAFNPALCELFGHLVIKSKEAYETIDEKSVTDILHSLTFGPYTAAKGKVKDLFTETE